jgi:hypothetical protein
MSKIQPQSQLKNSQHRWNLNSISIDKGKVFFIWRESRISLLLVVVFFIFLALVQFSTPDMPDNDGYYHIKMAYLMRTESLKPDFPWLPLTILNPLDFSDHHFLFHVALIPFTFGDLRLGAKWAAVVFASLAFFCVWNLLKNGRVPYAWLWALGLVAISEAFIYRMSVTRAQSLSLAVLMLGFDWLLRKKYYHLGVLAFVYVWLYDAFPLLLVLAGVVTLSYWLIERRLDLRPMIFVVVGIMLGLLINPYFPDNIIFAVQHILPKLTAATNISVGKEWYPYDTVQLLKNSSLSLVVFLAGALALGLSGKRIDARTLSSFILASLFGWMLFQSRRFIEYFPAFTLVFAAFAWAPVFQISQTSANKEEDDEVPPHTHWRMSSFITAWQKGGLLKNLPVLALLLLVLVGGWSTFRAAQASLKTSQPYQTFSGASAWLAEHTPAKSLIFQTDWDDFPRLFFYNIHNTYLVGLDPTYMSIYDAYLYERWVAITQGKVVQPSATISTDFGASYILTDLKHGDFLERAALDPDLVEVYRDRDAVVFQIIIP